MVGVPRSKGCLTCRRRKVACDQTKPHCNNCQKRGVQCEGYARYPTILQYTGSGLKKRERFEEAKRPDDLVVFQSSSSRQPQPGFSAFAAARIQPNVGTFVLGQVSVKCLDSYMPSIGSEGAVLELKRQWMYTMLDKSDQGQALGASFAALCFARIGLVNRDLDLISKGRTQYSLGLTALQHALQKPALAFQDQTLAAIRTLSIYELWSFPFTGKSNRAYVHEEGMTQWCLAAGPWNIKTNFALQVFHDVRWCIMNRAIDARKHSPLASEAWRTIPWRNTTKDSLQQLFDYGFDLAALFEQLDLCESEQLPEASVSRRAQLSLNCAMLQDSLETWYRAYTSSLEGSPQASAESGSELSRAASPGTAEPEFGDLGHATNVVYVWLFKMMLNDILFTTEPQDQQPDLAFSSLDLAVNILSSASYFLADGTGYLGPQRLFFPLKKAMAFLMSKQSPLATDAQQTFKVLVQKLSCDPDQ